MTWFMTDFRAALRIATGDSTLPYLWDDDSLNQATWSAVADHSLLFPRLTTKAYDVASNQQDFVLTTIANLLGAVGVECPVGSPIPQYDTQTSGPQRSHVSRASQAYRWQIDTLHLRVPASGSEVGTGTLLLLLAQGWTTPNDADEWDGPAIDIPLLLLLGRRHLYQQLAEWQARTQGLTTPAIASSSTNVHLDIPPLLAALEVQLTRALELRKPRTVAYAPLPVGR